MSNFGQARQKLQLQLIFATHKRRASIVRLGVTLPLRHELLLQPRDALQEKRMGIEPRMRDAMNRPQVCFVLCSACLSLM